MPEGATIDDVMAEIRALREAHELSLSQWCRGDLAGAVFAGFKSDKGFKTWAKQNGIKPSKSDGINFWDKHAIRKAHEKNAALTF